MDYHETMQSGENQYTDALDALLAAGLPSSFIQTGGMCAALEVRLEGGRTLLVTDADDTLAWQRDAHQGWGVGLYGDGEHDDIPLIYRQTEDSDVDALLVIVEDVLNSLIDT